MVSANTAPLKTNITHPDLHIGHRGYVAFCPLLAAAQPVDATHALNISAGVSNPTVSRGRSLSWQPEADTLLALDEIVAIQ